MQHKLRTRPSTVQDINALDAMVRCDIATDGCHFSNAHMIETFQAAFSRAPNNANLMSIYSNYTFNVLHAYALTEKVMRTAIATDPTQVQYRINLVKFLLHVGHLDAGRRALANLSGLNRFGVLDSTIAALEARLDRLERAKAGYRRGSPKT